MQRSAARVAPALIVAAAGCGDFGPFRTPPPTPIAGGLNPVELLDPAAVGDQTVHLRWLYANAERLRAEKRPAVLPPRRTVLALSGGGTYGAYPAGVLCGWTAAGTRPTFDVVTGISTGALIAPLAFLGPDYDIQLKELYTTLHNADLYTTKWLPESIFSESVADTSPLAKRIAALATDDLLAKVAAEHRKGRRLYVGTTDLESRRPVVWDLGEIAARGTPADMILFRKILLASASIPGLFPPVRVPVTVNGTRYEERHVDGGVTQAVFFRPPYIPPAGRAEPNCGCLYGSDLYAIIAGKMYADPDPVKPQSLLIAASSIVTLICAQTRDDLLKLYTTTVLTGMNYHVAAIPPEVPGPASSTDFDPVAMTRLFAEGVARGRAGTAWRMTPPGLEPGEGAFDRTGSELTRVPLAGPAQPITPTDKPGTTPGAVAK